MSQLVTRVGIELSQTLVWTANKHQETNFSAILHPNTVDQISGKIFLGNIVVKYLQSNIVLGRVDTKNQS